jgi:hypothetical protein
MQRCKEAGAMEERRRETPLKRETESADTNDGAVVQSPDAEPLYARQNEAEHDESRLELEATVELPDSVAALLDGIGRSVEEGGLLSYALADRFGALERCDRCGRPIIEPPTLAAALADEYRTGDEDRVAIEDAIRTSSLELGNEYAPNFCSYHGQITSE